VGRILWKTKKKRKKEEYFIELLNSNIPANSVGKTIYQKTEPLINDITQEEIE